MQATVRQGNIIPYSRIIPSSDIFLSDVCIFFLGFGQQPTEAKLHRTATLSFIALMDPITIVGAAAAVAQLLTQVTKTAASARNVVHSVINAPAEVTNLAAKLNRLKLLMDQLQKFVQEASNASECDYLFPLFYRDLLYNCLKSSTDALQAIQSLAPREKSGSFSVKRRVRWATIDKRRAVAIQADIKDAETELDAAISILGV